MNVPNAPQHPRRAAQEVTVDLGEPLPATQSTSSARRGNTGRFRKGLVAAIDLDSYEWKPDSKALIRATEATIVA